MNLDDLLRAIETGHPPPMSPPPQAATTLDERNLWMEFAQLQSQLLFMYRMVIQNNLKLSDETRALLIKLHTETERVWTKMSKPK